MKAQYFHIQKTTDTSFIVQKDRMKSFYGYYHYHPEIQITLIIAGKGQCIIGDRIINFNVGSILVIGENTPHVFHTKKDLSEGKYDYVDSISIYFDKNAFGEQFFNLRETHELNRFIEESAYSLEIKGTTRTYIEEIMLRLEDLFSHIILSLFSQR